MTDIFLSYARQDRDCAELLAEELTNRGWSVWWDREILVGRSFSKVIQSEIDQARCIIVLWSHSAVASGWVEDEANAAKERRILVPIRIEDVLPPLGFRSLQTAELLDWKEGFSGPEFELCLESIECLAPKGGGPAASPTASPEPASAPPKRQRTRRPAFKIAGTLAGLVGLILIIGLMIGMMGGKHESPTLTATAVTTATTVTDTSATTMTSASGSTAVHAAMTGPDKQSISVSLKNCYDKPLSVAITYLSGSNQWTSSGWYQVPAKSTKSNVLTVVGPLIYFYADSPDKRTWEGDQSDPIRMQAQVDYPGPFDGAFNQINGKDVTLVSYFGRRVDPGRNTYTQDFECN